jgi:hypothetical protein
MKKRLRVLTVITLIFITTSLNSAFAQPPNPGTQANGSGTNGGPIGAGAPVGSGEIILLVMVALYGGGKLYNAKQKVNEQ